MNNIPEAFLRKMGIYSMNLNGVAIQAKVVNHDQLVASGIGELNSRLDSRFPVVGFDLKYTENKESDSRFPVVGFDLKYTENKESAMVLVLHVKDRCLFVQLSQSRNRSTASSLSAFLNDRRICFLGVQMREKLEILGRLGLLSGRCPTENTGADIGIFVARALSDPDLVGCVNLVELATKAGYLVQEEESKIMATRCPEPQWDAVCFSKEEVEYAMREAYMCYSIGTKLMTALKG